MRCVGDRTGPFRILLVIHDFALGGTERIAVRLANAWVRDGLSITIFCGSEDGPLRSMLHRDVQVCTAKPSLRRRRGSVGSLKRALRHWLRGRQFDGAFVPGNYHWPVAPTLASADIPVVAQVSAALEKPQRGRVRQRFFDIRMRRLLRNVGTVVVLSEAAKMQADRILRRHVARVLPLPALDDDVPPPSPVPSADAHVVAVGRLVPEKGFAELIRAFAQVVRPAARLTILGDGPARAELERHVQRLGLTDRVSLVGYVPDVRPWLDRARLFVLSSWFEGYPAVIIEALAAGRPVIATDCTPATALLTNGSGEAVPVADVGALAAAMDRALGKPPPDPEVLAASVAHHRIGAVALGYVRLFHAVACRTA